ncbi:hypothetical protein GCM10023310_53660 [Paenibacillus vulneris]|uniref:Two-component system regulatory protein YycI n=1 Tax=Paenibacillus vulneris TaxID=1133364 RepID=A0ABW3UQI6_9BACL|nr:two-component system regulatory protein YycI [Paenibacillus sp. 32352]
MDWSRAKTILILSFFLLNLVLGYQLWTTRSDLLEFDPSTASATEEIQRLMKSKNIQITAEMPKEVPRMKEIVVQYDEKLTMENPVPLETPFKYSPLLSKGSSRDAAARAAIPNMDKYLYDPVLSTNGTYVFHELYGAYPMFEVKLELTEQNGMVVAYRQEYANVKQEGEQKEQKVISPYTVLSSLIENYFPSGTVVSSIMLGYHNGQTFNSQTMFLVPYWRVVGNGDIYYVHALNGAVDPPQKNKK